MSKSTQQRLNKSNQIDAKQKTNKNPLKAPKRKVGKKYLGKLKGDYLKVFY